MKRITLFIIIVSLAVISQAQVSQFGGDIHQGYVLGVRIYTSWSSPVVFFEAYYDGKNLKDITVLPKNVFINKIMGRTKSPANPNNENLFAVYNIENPRVIDSLWKLRYAVYPFATMSRDTLGWTGNFKNPYVPTHSQKQILYSVGMDSSFYVIFGENFFKLLQLMNDPNWVERYKNARE